MRVFLCVTVEVHCRIIESKCKTLGEEQSRAELLSLLAHTKRHLPPGQVLSEPALGQDQLRRVSCSVGTGAMLWESALTHCSPCLPIKNELMRFGGLEFLG